MNNDYITVNSSFENPFLFSLTGRGLYSEVNNLLNAILYGLVTKRRLIVDDSRFSNGNIAWNDLYTSQLPSEIEAPSSEVANEWRIVDNKSAGFKAIRKCILEWHNSGRILDLHPLGIVGNVFAAKRSLALRFCRPLTPIDTASAPNLPYAALHIRRGDKIDGYLTRTGKFIVEGDDISPSSYLTAIHQTTPHIKSVFVITDDYATIKALSILAPDLMFWTFCREPEKGYDNQEFMLLDRASKLDRLQSLTKSVEIAAKAATFIGCYRSNASRFIALTHNDPKSCQSIDSQRLWQPL